MPSASSQARRPARWAEFDSVSELAIIVPSFASHGHGTGAWDAEIRGNAAAVAGFDDLRPESALPVGALLVESHVQRHSGAALGLFAMRKGPPGSYPAGGDWEYFAIERDGIIAASGKLDACARCHADAAADFVFPRYQPAAASSAD